MRKKRFKALLLILLLSSPSLLWAQNLGRRFNLNVKNKPLSTVLKQIDKKSGVKILFAYDDVNTIKVSYSRTNVSAEEVLRALTQSYPLTYEIKAGGKFISVSSKSRKSRGNIINGVVKGTDGETMIGATITIKFNNGRTQHITTDKEGRFFYPMTGNEVSMTASTIGYNRDIKKIKAGKTHYIFELEPDAHNLNEVVVTGIFNKPKASFTGAATVITKEQIQQQGNRNLLKTLTNIDPSFDVQLNNDMGSDPNKQLSIEIRGKSSLAADISDMNNVQDDIRNQYNMPLFILDGFEVSSERVMDMNQSDVESVVILKDASATAIYGSRGANGVVVITSTRPQEGRVRVSYSVGMNLELPDLSSYNLMNSFEKLEVEKIAGVYKSDNLSTQLQLDAIYNENLKAAKEGVNTDWIHKPLRTGIGQYHRLSLSGGTNQFRYNLNFSYNQLKGVMKGSGRDNMNGGVQITYILKKVRFTNDLSVGINNSNESTYGQFSDYVGMNPYWRPKDDEGHTIKQYNFPGYNYPIYNPLYDGEQSSFIKSEYINLRNTTNINWDICEGLRADLSLGITQQRNTGDSFYSPLSTIGTSTRGRYSKNSSTSTSWQVSGTLSWAKIIGMHTFYLGGNWQMMQNNLKGFDFSVIGFMNDQMTDLSMGTNYYGQKPSSTDAVTRSIGFTGTFNYNFASRYFVDASYRVDGASSFGAESRWAPFWSVGAGWEFTKESWMKFIEKVVNYGKIRYSYGVTSSLNFAPYDAFTTYQYDNENQYNGLIGAYILGYGNPNLKWQNTREHNYGMDVSFFNSFITLSANIYRKTTDNLLTDAYLPISHGYTTYKSNMGTIRNTGWDLSLNINVLRLREQDITWALRFGAYSNKNILVKLSDSIKKLMESNSNASNKAYYQYREGYSIDELYVLRSAGVDPMTGERLYIGDDGTISNIATNSTPVPVGNRQPKLNGRLGTSFRWKGLLLDVGFGLRLGAKVLNQTLLDKVENGNIRRNNDKRITSLRWQKPGDIAAYKALGIDNPTFPNDAFVFTEKAFTCNSVNLSYQFPRSVVRYFKMQQLTITGSLSDVFYISNIERERGTSYPYTIKPTFSISCTF